MIHHVSLGTNDLEKAKAFYDAVMPHLGLRFIKKSERIPTTLHSCAILMETK
jgi:catechol 2,3-dioxygenase-like lactoylglutathione lyase family enzyme